MPEISNLFPLSIYKERLEIDADYKNRLVDEILEMGNYDVEKKPGSAWTGDVHALDSLHNEEFFQKLFQSFSKPLLGYLDHLGIDPQKIDLYFTRSWATISRHNEKIGRHSHVESHISLVYYLKKPANAGMIVFGQTNPPNEFSPHLFHAQVMECGIKYKNTIFNSDSALVDPNEGDLFIFPSKTQHGTTRNETSDIRISVTSDIVATLREPQHIEVLMPRVDQWRKIT